MSDSPQYEAFRAFARSEIRAGKLELKAELAKELKDEFKEILTREAPKAIEIPPAKDGKDGRGVDKVFLDGNELYIRYTDSEHREHLGRVVGKDGEDGENGFATLEDVKAAAQEVFADFQVRTFADIYTGVYKPGESYTRSQFTTWGGSLWLALSDTKGKPGETPDWKLVVKK